MAKASQERCFYEFPLHIANPSQLCSMHKPPQFHSRAFCGHKEVKSSADPSFHNWILPAYPRVLMSEVCPPNCNYQCIWFLPMQYNIPNILMAAHTYTEACYKVHWQVTWNISEPYFSLSHPQISSWFHPSQFPSQTRVLKAASVDQRTRSTINIMMVTDLCPEVDS